MTYLSKPNFVKLSANIATVLLAFFIGVQLLVAVGVIPISILWGGRQTELTLALRLTSVVAALILSVFVYVIRSRAGLMGTVPPSTAVRVGAWVMTAYLALNTLGNFVSVSPVEKLLFGPLTILLTAACVIVAASSSS